MKPSELPPFEVFYDGDCPLCMKEISMIRKLDRSEKLRFTDIAAPSFDAFRETGKNHDALMAEIHGRMADGSLVIGVEVFRQLYMRTVFCRLIPLTRIWGIRHALDLGYVFFAKHRLRFTGRCKSGSCSIPTSA